jgi:predicted transcriptional regulator
MSKKFNIKTIHLSGEGPEKVLGELEVKVMEYIWKNEEANVMDIRDALEKSYKKLSSNSVRTIVKRLVAKGILQKKEINGIFVFSSIISQDKFNNTITAGLLSALIKDPKLFSVASFADVAKGLDKKSLKKLKDFLDQKKV